MSALPQTPSFRLDGRRALVSGAGRGTPVPALLLSHGAALVDQPLALRDIISGLAEGELPGHTKQLLALLPADAGR